ncbi:MAG TPA: hypothetical protein VEA38_13575, partial [Terriglobales bacterium]|nr:hypothetical protein [Terriglobales bacterium]
TEKTPYLHKRFDAEEIFERSNRLAAQWQQAGIEFAHEDVAQYLEFESRKRILGSDGASTPQQVSGAAGKPAGSAPKVKANGPRTLSAATGSERRTSPKPIREMTAEEERDALVAEVAEMRRKMGPRDTG